MFVVVNKRFSKIMFRLYRALFRLEIFMLKKKPSLTDSSSYFVSPTVRKGICEEDADFSDLIFPKIEEGSGESKVNIFWSSLKSVLKLVFLISLWLVALALLSTAAALICLGSVMWNCLQELNFRFNWVNDLLTILGIFRPLICLLIRHQRIKCQKCRHA